jgi:hypothetical protein
MDKMLVLDAVNPMASKAIPTGHAFINADDFGRCVMHSTVFIESHNEVLHQHPTVCLLTHSRFTIVWLKAVL